MLEDTVEKSITRSVEKETLCKKYDISVDKLSFEYVKDCKNVRELERIVKILRSGEEGHYSELQKDAENQLRTIAPNSRLLRTEEPIVRREAMMPEERERVDSDLKQFVNDVSSKDKELTDWNKNYPAGSGDHIPPVRKTPPKKVDSRKQLNSKKIKPQTLRDYNSWDKYDADAELLKIDAEEERKKTEEEIKMRKQNTTTKVIKEEHSRLNFLVNSAENMSDTERSVHAAREKDRGNEYYKACNYDDAIEYYTASIEICPNAVAYNNRAASYLKQGKYDLALNDVNRCLELDPENTKGLYRRGLCLQHKNKFNEALQDMQAVLRKEPRNLVVQHVAKELRQQCGTVPRSVRMLVVEEEEEDKEDRVVEISESDARSIRAGFEVNEWGLATSICTCYGRPPFMFINGTDIANHLIYKPEDKKKKKKKLPMKEILPQHFPDPENLFKKPLVSEEVICNGSDADESMETDQITFGRNADNESNNCVPKKIKIIETVKATNDSLSGSKEYNKPKKCVVKDMRGQKPVQGEREMMEQLNNVTIDEPVPCTATVTESRDKRLYTRQDHQSNDQQENNERNSSHLVGQNRRSVMTNYEFHVPSEKQLISIASKYTQKVASAKNINAQSDIKYSSKCGGYENINNINNFSNNASLDNFSNESLITPFQFSHLWNSVKDFNNFKEYANILRRIQPSRLRLILANKLDGTMLLALLNTLSSEFDVTNRDEVDLIKQYLVALSQVERFTISVSFLSPDVKQLTSCLIEKVGGEDTSQLMKSYLV